MVYMQRVMDTDIEKLHFITSSSISVALGKILGHSFFKVRVLRRDEFSNNLCLKLCDFMIFNICNISDYSSAIYFPT